MKIELANFKKRQLDIQTKVKTAEITYLRSAFFIKISARSGLQEVSGKLIILVEPQIVKLK